MSDESDFLRMLLDNPADDNTRMVYADWLDDLGDPESRAKAHFLRVSVRLTGPIQRVGWRARRQELRALAQELPEEWLAVVSKGPVERCADPEAKPDKRYNGELELQRLGVRFNSVCDRRWDEMRPTPDVRVRHCERCQKDVHYCDTLDNARMHAKLGHCVAVSAAEERNVGDLDVRPGIVLGGAGLV